MRNLIRFALALCLLSSFAGFSQADVGETVTTNGQFYQWVGPDGSLSFTNDPKGVPGAYRNTAKTRTWEELEHVKLTPMTISAEEYARSVYIPRPAGEPDVNPNHLNDCTGPVTVVSERVQQDEYDRRMYQVVDECGRASTYTRSSPRILIER